MRGPSDKQSEGASARPEAARQAAPQHQTTLRTADPTLGDVEGYALDAIAGTERFELLEPLASGGQATVFRARNRDSREVVALKVFYQSPREAHRALKEEFRSLARLRHPGIVRLFELYIGTDYAFFTMEHLVGTDLAAYVRDARARQREAPWDAVRLTITQLALAIEAAHDAGLLHLDIKPSNVLVTAAGRVVLLDFGLVRRALQGATAFHGGTPAYMPPEQVAGATLSERSDWYAFGAVLHELLTGAPPAPSKATTQRSRPGRDSRHLPLQDCPEDLVQLCQELLQTTPDARPTGREVLARLGALPPRYERSAGSREPLIGRTLELTSLRALLDEHSARDLPKTTLVQISGPAGVGKTALVRRFVEQQACEQRAHVLHGRCFEHALLPYKLLDELMDRLAETLRGRPLALVSDADLRGLARLFPVFGGLRRSDVSEASPEPEPAPQALAARAIDVLSQLLRELASDGLPIVIWLDDVHWTDRDSVPLLLAWLARGTTSLLVLLSGRSCEPDHPLQRGIAQLTSGAHRSRLERICLPLEGLTAQQARALVAQLDASQLPACERIWQQSQGNPLRLVELVRHGAVEHLPTAPPHAPGASLEQLYIGRLARLTPRARRLLELAALSEQALPSELLSQAAAELDASDDTLLELQRGSFIESATHAHLALAHDTLRQCIRGYLLSGQRRAAHRRLADLYLAHDAENHEALAYHYEGAGEISRALQHLKKGAEASAAALAYERAATLYEHAYTLLGDADPDQRGALRRQQAQSREHASQTRSAAGLLALAGSASEPAAAPAFTLRAVELYLLAGHFEQAEPKLRELLRAVGLPSFRSEQSALLRALLELALIALRGLPTRGDSERPDDPSERMRIEVCQAALRGYSASATFRGAVYGVILLRLAYRSGEVWRIALASVHVAGFLTFSNLAWAKRFGQRLLERARRMAQGDAELLALIDSGIGTQELFAGAWRRAYAKLSPDQAAAGLERRFGPEWNLAGQMSLIALDHLGRAAQLRHDAYRWLEHGLQHDNRMVAGESRVWCALCELAADRPDDAWRQLELAEASAPGTGFLYVHWVILRVRVQSHLYAGDFRQAALALRRESRALRRSGLLTIQFIRVLTCQLEALAISGEAATQRSGRRAARARLAYLARQLADDTAPHARAAQLVVRASSELLAARLARAIESLRRAAALYRTADMALHAAALELCCRGLRGEAGASTDGLWPEEHTMKQLGIAAPRRWVRCIAPYVPHLSGRASTDVTGRSSS